MMSSLTRTLGLLSFSLLAGCGIESSLVGGRCREGMILSGDTCVAQEPGVTLVAPTDPPMGSFGNTVNGRTSPADVRPTDLPPKVVQPTVLPPIEDAPFELVCGAPLVACHGECISVASDAANCGACGKICPSNICIDGECMGAMPGDVVLIGHDYSGALPRSAQAKVLANAIAIPTTDPIRVLSYGGGATAEAVAETEAVARQTVLGRSVRYTHASSASALASATLGREYDVVLIHDASAADPAALGMSWSESLGLFTTKGGVVIALDGGDSPVPALLSSAGLLAVGAHTKLAASTHMLVTTAADAVGVQVLSPYAAFTAPVSFQGLPSPDLDLSWVIRAKKLDGTPGDPVVVHRIVR